MSSFSSEEEMAGTDFWFWFHFFLLKVSYFETEISPGTTVVGRVLFFFFPPNTLQCIGINGLVRGLNTILYPRNLRLWLRKHSYTLQILNLLCVDVEPWENI